MTMYAPIRIVIADDHEIFRNGFKLLLQDQNMVELAGEAEDGRQLVEVAHQQLPHVVITDIKMPRMDGIAATKRIREELPEIGVIALSNFNDDGFVMEMLEAGAKGYLLKNTNRHELMTAIKAVYEGEAYYCSGTSNRLIQLIAESRIHAYKSKKKVELTPREIDVIRLVCKQYTNKEIASELNLSIRTIESYREHIQEKIGVRNSVGIAVYAIKNKIYNP